MDNFYTNSSHLFKALSSPVRLQLIQFVSFCPRTVEECAEKTNQSIQNVSLHLMSLTKIGLLKVEKIKNYRFYQLENNEVTQLVLDILRCHKESALEEKLICEKIEKSELKDYRIIDLRSEEEASYIPLKGVFPFREQLSKLPHVLKQFKKTEKILFICKGRQCPRLALATLKGKELGYKVQALVMDAFQLREFSAQL